MQAGIAGQRRLEVRAAAREIGTRMKNILVTGGAGYIGSHTCKILKDLGYNPVTYDHLGRGFEKTVKFGPLVRGDISDQIRLVGAIRDHEIHAVIHFAALAYVGESVSDPALYYRNNVTGSLALLESMREAGINKIVFSSTCSIYGIPEELPISESAPPRPINPYGRSKLMVEMMLKDYFESYKLSSVSLRYFNAAGALPEAGLGEFHDPETHIIPLAIDAAMGRRAPVTIFGLDYSTPDGTCIRDYVHVEDLAMAHILALKHLEGVEGAFAFNLGTGRGRSVREILASVSEVVGAPTPFIEGSRRSGDPAVLVADARRAEKVLGWKARHLDLNTIVRSAFESRVK